MNATPNDPMQYAGMKTGSISIDDTLRLIANAPVPEGIEDRVHAALRAAPRQSRVLAWPAAEPAVSWGNNSWMRGAAAAVIMFVVAGGGWEVYMRVQQPEAKVMVTPAAQPPAVGGGFSSAAAIRTPPTVKGPVVMQPTSPENAKHGKKAATAKVQPVPLAAAK